MATITASVRSTETATQINVTLQSSTAIADPSAYRATAAASAEILARAGLDADLEFVSAVLTASVSSGGVYYYDLIVTYGDAPSGTTTHTHDETTVSLSLDDAYQDGPTITLDTTLGPMIITHTDDTTTDYLRIRTDTATASRFNAS